MALYACNLSHTKKNFTMKLERLSAWSEILSSIAILITLVYLAIQTSQNADQIRQNVEATKASTRQQILSTDITFLRDILENPDITSVQYKENLTNAEKTMLASQYTMFLRQRENNWIQFKNGALDHESLLSMQSTIKVLAHQPNFHIYWNNLMKTNYAKGFDPELTKLIADIVDKSMPGKRAIFIELMEPPIDSKATDS
jgi:hypothetical protein